MIQHLYATVFLAIDMAYLVYLHLFKGLFKNFEKFPLFLKKVILNCLQITFLCDFCLTASIMFLI